MMKYIICLFALLTNVLFLFGKESTPDITEIEANSVEYNGKQVILIGQVKMDHPFGILHCDKATLHFAQEHERGKKLSPDKIFLTGNVQAFLKDKSTLSSDDGEIDCKTYEGYFTSHPPTKVIYTTVMGEGEKATPVKASSKAMRLKMSKQETNKKAEYVLSDIKSDDTVRIEYQNG